MKDTLTALPLHLSNRLKHCFNRLDSLQAWLSEHKASLLTSSITTDISEGYNREDSQESEGDVEDRETSQEDQKDLDELPLTAGTWPKRLIKASLMAECGLLEDKDKEVIEKYCHSYDFKTGPPVGENSEEVRTLLRNVETFAYQGHPSFKEFTKRVQSTKRGYK